MSYWDFLHTYGPRLFSGTLITCAFPAESIPQQTAAE